MLTLDTQRIKIFRKAWFIRIRMQRDWYHGYLSPAQSDILLQDQRENSFLLRSSRVKVREKIFSFVKGGKIRNIKVIDDTRNEFMQFFQIFTTEEAVEKMYECSRDFDYPVTREENQAPAPLEIMQFDPLVCSICECQFHTSTQLTNHKNSHHILKYCSTCNEFFQATNRQRHKDYCNKRKFTCQQCNVEFNSRTNLKSHEKLHAKGRLAFACDICDKRFSHVEMVESHKTSQHKLKIKCGFCPKMFTLVESKVQHEKLIHLRTTKRMRKPLYECDECGKCFVKPSTLKIHRRVHDDESNNGQYACGTCGHLCGSKTLLRRHETQHHNANHVIPENLVISMSQKHPVSNRRLTDFIMDVKEENGPDSITACFKKKQSATLNALIDLVVCEQVNLPNNDKDLENTVIAYFEDLERLIFKVSKGRQIQDPIYTVGIDGGQMKLLFSLFIHDNCHQGSEIKDEAFSSGGVRRSLLAAVGDYVCESREHMLMLYNKLKLAEITQRRKIFFIGDMKAHCLMAGIQLKGTFNCYMGTCIKINVQSPCLGEFDPTGDLENFENHLKQHWRTGCTECQSGVGGPNIWWLDGDLRTTESCKKDKQEWKNATQNLTEEEAWDKLKHFNSQFDDPFPMTNDESIPLQELMPLDPLHHILLGVCIDLFSGLEREFEIMPVFYSRAGCLKKLAKQPSKSFSGPQVKQLWEEKNLLKLEQMLTETNEKSHIVRAAIDYLKSLKSLHVLCVSKTRDDDYINIIEHFRKCFKKAWDLDLINNTPKAHQLLSKIHLEAHLRSGKTFWYTDTNGTERCHSGAKTFQQRHNLQVTKKIGTKTHAKKVKQLVAWWSSKNLGYNPLLETRDSSWTPTNDVPMIQPSDEDCLIDTPSIDESLWMPVPLNKLENLKTRKDLEEFIQSSRLPVEFDQDTYHSGVGNCFFDAICAQIKLHGIINAPQHHDQLRREVCNFMETDKSGFQWTKDVFAGNRGKFLKMVNYYRKLGNWAEGFVIAATALYLGMYFFPFFGSKSLEFLFSGRNISVISTEKPNSETFFTVIDGGPEATTRDCFILGYLKDQHYYSLKTSEELFIVRYRNVQEFSDSIQEDVFNEDEILTSTPKRTRVDVENIAANVTVPISESESESSKFYEDLSLYSSVQSPNSTANVITTECYFCGDIMGIHHVTTHLRLFSKRKSAPPGVKTR